MSLDPIKPTQRQPATSWGTDEWAFAGLVTAIALALFIVGGHYISKTELFKSDPYVISAAYGLSPVALIIMGFFIKEVIHGVASFIRKLNQSVPDKIIEESSEAGEGLFEEGVDPDDEIFFQGLI